MGWLEHFPIGKLRRRQSRRRTSLCIYKSGGRAGWSVSQSVRHTGGKKKKKNGTRVTITRTSVFRAGTYSSLHASCVMTNTLGKTMPKLSNSIPKLYPKYAQICPKLCPNYTKLYASLSDHLPMVLSVQVFP